MSWRQIEAALASARAMRATIDAHVAALEAALEGKDDDEAALIDLKTIKKEFDIGRDALKAAAEREELKLARGPRKKLLAVRGEVRAWQRSREYQPTERRRVADLEAWKAEASRALEPG